MPLEEYRRKRDFKHTSEPDADINPQEGALKFVVHRHQARRLHYDLRLELDGVLKSWAVPKGPSMDPSDKRLAIMVEDHPYGYINFEGEIPRGNYGAGQVDIWDYGSFHALETADRDKSEKKLLESLSKGEIKFVLNGTKLKGEFVLVRTKTGNNENNWLLIKHKDEFAIKGYNSEDYISFNKNPSRAPASGEPTIITQKDPMPHLVEPMLAKLVREPFDKDGWIYEIKFDGYRAIAEIENGNVKLYSRNGLSFNRKYPQVFQELRKIKHNAVLDGEIVALDKNGVSKFQLLQQFDKTPEKINLAYFVFDLLWLNGKDMTETALIDRKQLLKTIITDNQIIKYSDYISGQGMDFYNEAKNHNLEGIIAKKADSPYRIGKRTSEWLKIKIQQRQEAIIAGFTAPRGARKHFGSLILGVYDHGELQFIGHSGGGFTDTQLVDLKKSLDNLVINESPFKTKIKTNAPVTWVKPEIICEVSFSEWTEDGQMRQPVFIGIRSDKDPKEISREIPDIEPKQDAIPALKRNGQENSSADNKILIQKDDVNKEVVLENKKLKLTNLNKIYWPDEGYTKADLINYYHQIAPIMLPYLKNRPENLNRHPNGIKQPSFYQKDMPKLPEWAESIKIYSESNEKESNYLICNSLAMLVYMANLGCIEINPWNARVNTLEKPDYFVIDLDPDDNPFDEVVDAALATKEILDKARIASFPKTSGSTGMHIYVPLNAKYTYDEARDFAHIIVQLVHERLPKNTSLERNPKKRKGKIYLDYLQNRTGQTLAAAYSVRPRPGATVSTPLDWKEVKHGLTPGQFNIWNIHERLEQIGDIFKGTLGKGIDIQKNLKLLGMNSEK